MVEHTQVEDTQRVLHQCASTLLSAVSRLGSSTSISTSGPSTSSSGQQQSPVSLTHSTAVSTAQEEHHRLFGFQPQTSIMLEEVRPAPLEESDEKLKSPNGLIPSCVQEKLMTKLFFPSSKRECLPQQAWGKEKSLFPLERAAKC